MFKMFFADLKTGSIRRLPYLGYSVLYAVLLILLICFVMFPIFVFDSAMSSVFSWIILIPIFLAIVPLSFYVTFVLGVKRLRNMGSDRPYLWSVVCMILDIVAMVPIAFLVLCLVPEGWLTDFMLKETKEKSDTKAIEKN